MTVSLQKSSNTLETPTPAAPRAHRKPQADIYTFLLVLALLAVLVAILFLYLFMKTYRFEASGAPSAAMVTHNLSLVASAWFPGL
jgi:hypothetical protein